MDFLLALIEAIIGFGLTTLRFFWSVFFIDPIVAVGLGVLAWLGLWVWNRFFDARRVAPLLGRLLPERWWRRILAVLAWAVATSVLGVFV